MSGPIGRGSHRNRAGETAHLNPHWRIDDVHRATDRRRQRTRGDRHDGLTSTLSHGGVDAVVDPLDTAQTVHPDTGHADAFRGLPDACGSSTGPRRSRRDRRRRPARFESARGAWNDLIAFCDLREDDVALLGELSELAEHSADIAKSFYDHVLTQPELRRSSAERRSTRSHGRWIAISCDFFHRPRRRPPGRRHRPDRSRPRQNRPSAPAPTIGATLSDRSDRHPVARRAFSG